MKQTPTGQWTINTLTHRIIIVLFFVLLIAFVWCVRGILAPFILAAVGAYLLHPAIDELERRGIGRLWSILAIYLLIVLLLTVVVILIIPLILEEISRISADFPRYREQVLGLLEQLESTYAQVDIPETLRQWPEDALRDLQRELPGLIQAGVGALAGSVNTLITLLMAALLAFYLLKDWAEFSNTLLNVVPVEWRGAATYWAKRANRVLSGYIRGQLIVALIVGAVTGITLQLLGMRYAFIVAVAAGIGNLVPYLGPLVGGTLGLLLAGFQSWMMMLKVALVFIVVQQLEGSILSPNVMQYSVGLHPFWVIFSLFAGGALFGFWGVVTAVPTAALLCETIQVYKEFFEVE